MIKSRRWTSVRVALVSLVAAGAMLASAPATRLSAQDVRVRHDDCHCTDSDGNVIENCTCFRAGGPDGVFANVWRFGGNRARIGITLDPVQTSSQDAQGALVTGVLEDGPAAKAGIRENDLITHVDGRSLFEPLDAETEEDFDLDESIPVQRLLAIAHDLEPGTEVELRYLRDGAEGIATVEAEEIDEWSENEWVSPNWDADALQERMSDLSDRFRHLRGGNVVLEGDGEPLRLRWEARGAPGDVAVLGDGKASRVLLERMGRGGNVLAFSPDEGMFSECPGAHDADDEEANEFFFSEGYDCVGGLALMELKPGLADYFEADGGVLVTDVHEDSATGLEAGDVITAIGDREVGTPTRARRILRSYSEGEEVTFHIVRRGREMTVTGSLAR